MVSSITALQGLYVALGGELSDVANITTIPDMLEAISTVASAAASELPIVTSDDNGKVLTVVEGGWNKANLPASGYTKTVLYDGLTVSGQVTLSDSYKNYDALVFEVYYGEGEPSSIFSPYIPTDSDIGVRYLLDFGYNQVDDSKSKVYFEFSSNTSLNWLGDTNPIYKVIGIKF